MGRTARRDLAPIRDKPKARRDVTEYVPSSQATEQRIVRELGWEEGKSVPSLSETSINMGVFGVTRTNPTSRAFKFSFRFSSVRVRFQPFPER